jgi:hypothetical protein
VGVGGQVSRSELVDCEIRVERLSGGTKRKSRVGRALNPFRKYMRAGEVDRAPLQRRRDSKSRIDEGREKRHVTRPYPVLLGIGQQHPALNSHTLARARNS